MKRHQFFFLPLSFLTGFLAADNISPNETKPKKAKLPKIKKENNVLLLKKSNCDRALKETKYLLVEFCINFRCLLPWRLCRAWLLLGHSGMPVLLLLCPPVVLVCFVFLHVSISDVTTVIYSFLVWLSTSLLHKTDTDSKMGPRMHSAELASSASAA